MTSTHTSMSVIWSAVLSVDSDHVFARREETIMRRREVFAGNAETIAAEVIQDWLEDDGGGFSNWDETFGPDEIAADGIVVIVHEPDVIAGRYSVECERVLKARARRLDAKESAALDVMLAREDVA